jgi:hypothetical protein
MVLLYNSGLVSKEHEMTETKRLTAAEKRALVAAQRAEDNRVAWAEFTASYPVRFANLMYRYMTLDYAQFRVKKLDEETFEFYREDYRYSDLVLKVTPPANWNWEYLNEVEQAEALLADYDREQAEERRKESVRLAALSKLTAEERELLNL